MPYRLVIEFETVQELKEKLRKLLQELDTSTASPSQSLNIKVRVVCDETVRKIGNLLVRLGKERGLDLEVYEIDSATDTEYTLDGVTYLPARDDLDVLRHVRNLDAILVTGDKKLATTARAYGLQVIYLPPANVHSKEDYALRVIEEVTKHIRAAHGTS